MSDYPKDNFFGITDGIDRKNTRSRFIALSAYGHNKFIEMPVEIVRTGSSTISFRNIASALIDMLRIFWRARVSLNYDALAYTSIHEPQETRK